jgi:hypothetical protein
MTRSRWSIYASLTFPVCGSIFRFRPGALDLGSFAEGVGFDGSSIRGFQEIQDDAL